MKAEFIPKNAKADMVQKVRFPRDLVAAANRVKATGLSFAAFVRAAVLTAVVDAQKAKGEHPRNVSEAISRARA